jgi:poly(3-hydroxybutyrate) depolymerase
MTIRIPFGPSPRFAGAKQPARRPFGIGHVSLGGRPFPVRTRDIAASPFCTLVEFSGQAISPAGDFLIVAPLSGHFPVLARDLIVGLLPHFRVYITDWTNARYLPERYGPLGLQGNIGLVIDCIRALPPGLNVLGLCQGGIPALAAAALLAQREDPKIPASLVLMASAIDPLANPTRVVNLIRSRPLSWFNESVVAAVPAEFPGAGRLVYPAELHLLALWSYLTRHVGAGTDTAAKLFFDDGGNPSEFPFLDLFSSLMDLDAAFFYENIRDVFHDRLLPQRALHFKGERIDPSALRATALMTVEGERDDIAAPGQTEAAHALASSLPSRLRRRLVVPRAGHFSLFYGDTWRVAVLPEICSFCSRDRRPRQAGELRKTSEERRVHI